MTIPTLPSSSRRLVAGLLPALLGRGHFTPGRQETQRAITGLGDSLCRWLEQNSRLVLLGGNPEDPVACAALGLADGLIDPAAVVDDAVRKDVRMHLAGFWRDRRLALLSLRKGLTAAEFDHFYHLLVHYAGKGLKLRSRLFDEQARGHLPHVSLVFLDDLPATAEGTAWPARTSLAWVYRDLNLLSRGQHLPTRERVAWREHLLGLSIGLPQAAGVLADFFADLDLIAEEIDDYDKDELVFALLEHLEADVAGDLCLQLCARFESLARSTDQEEAVLDSQQKASLQWITRRLADHMLEGGLAGPEHLHALVLHKVLLYEEIPQKMRPRVASLQVLTSFLANPKKYFAEVESSHSPEVLETRLWRILEMTPRLIQALRFDVACQVLDFSKRFGPTFELQHKPEIMAQLMDAAAGVLTETPREKQAALMHALPKMGRTGMRLLIDLSDHQNRSVRRTAIDALIKIGQPIVPVLFATLEGKRGWHYLRNMLLILTQLNAGGPKVERLFRQSLDHPEANVRKEALPGLARLLKNHAAAPVAKALGDQDMEVRKRAAACLGMTGIDDPQIYQRLANILKAKDCKEELAIQIVASINKLKPEPPEKPALELALISLLGAGGLLGIGSRKSSASQTLRIATVQALGFIGTARSRKILTRMSTDQSMPVAAAAKASLARLAAG